MTNMLRMIVPVGALFMGVALLLMGMGLLNTLLPLRGELEGYSTRFLGLILSGYFAGFLLGTFLGPRLIRRIGHIRAFACCAAVVTSCAILHALVVDPYVWLALRLVTGTALVTLYTAIESWLNGQTTSQNRGQMLALYMIVNLVALALAQQFVPLASPQAFMLFAVAAMFVCSALIPVTLTRFEPPPAPVATKMAVGTVMRMAPIAVVGAVLSGMTMGSFWTLSPVFANGVYGDVKVVAGFMSAAILGGAALQIPLGRYSDAHDRRAVLVWAAALAGVCALFMSAVVMWLPQLHWLFYLAGFAYGGFAFAMYPLAAAHLIDHLEPDQVLDGCSTFLLIHGAGAVIGPIVSGFVMELSGPGILPLLFAGMQFLLAGSVVLVLHRMPTLVQPAEQNAHYVPMVRTSPSVIELHPDQPEPVLETDADIDTGPELDAAVEAPTEQEKKRA